MKTFINTLKEFLPYIKNTLENPYSNGVMERNNNNCKLIKRNAFGFRNFRNFKKNFTKIKKKRVVCLKIQHFVKNFLDRKN